jgi:outer membrane protein TolC
MIKNAEIRYQNGLSKISAYYKAKASLGNIKNMQLMYENDIKEKRIRLNALMNRNAMLPLEIDTSFQFNDYADLVFDKDLFYKNRSDLKALDKEINIANLQQENEKQSLKPEFGFRYENMVGLAATLQYTAMIMIKLPFVSWASKMNKANIESLKWKASSLESQKK